MNTIESSDEVQTRLGRAAVLRHLRIMKRPTAFQGNPGDFDSPEYHNWMARDDAYTNSREELLRRLAAYNQRLGLPADSMD